MASHQLSLAQRIGIHYYRTRILILQKISTQAAARAALNLFTSPHTNTKRKESPLFKNAHRYPFVFEGITLMAYRFSASTAVYKKILIIHGFSGSSRSFERYISPAVKKGYEVHIFDAPAHGLSQGKRVNALEYRDAIIQMTQLNGPFDAYMAHSLGGLSLMLALEQMAPANKPKIILIAPATESVTAADNFFNVLRLPGTIRLAFDKLIEDVRSLPLSWYSVSRVLPHIAADILWIHDEEDLTTPVKDVWPLVKNNLPNVQFHFTKGLGHSGIYKNEAVKNLIIDYL